jgi:hypothetical protein
MTSLFISKMHNYFLELKPSIASLISTLAIGGNAAVWFDAIKGWSAVLTVIIGAPTALLIMLYWAIKVKNEWDNRKGAK